MTDFPIYISISLIIDFFCYPWSVVRMVERFEWGNGLVTGGNNSNFRCYP